MIKQYHSLSNILKTLRHKYHCYIAGNEKRGKLISNGCVFISFSVSVNQVGV